MVIKQGETFKVSLDEIVNCSDYAECNVFTEYARGLLYEGTLIEWWGSSLNEVIFGHWFKKWRKALLGKYNFKDGNCTASRFMRRSISWSTTKVSWVMVKWRE